MPIYWAVLKTDQLVQWAMDNLYIHKPKTILTDTDIKAIVRWIGEHVPDTCFENGEPLFNRNGIGVMLFVTYCEFHAYYKKHNLNGYLLN